MRSSLEQRVIDLEAGSGATTSSIGALINGSTAATPNNSDYVATSDTSVLKKITWTNVKAFLKTYFDTLYGTTWTEATRDASGITTAGYRAYNTDRNRWEFYEPFWGWHPIALTPSAMRDWGFEAIEDFSQSTASWNWLGGALNAGTVSNSSSFSVVRLDTGTNTNGGYRYTTGSNAFQLGSNPFRSEGRVRVNTNSDGTQTFQVLAGFFDTFTAVNQVDGAYFLYDSQGVSTGSAASGNWQIVTVSNSTRTFTTTSVAIDNSNFQKLRVDVNAAATSVDFYINDVNVGTHTTNIPSGSSRTTTSGVYIQKSAGTTARTADIDYLYLKAKFTTPR